MRRPLYFTGILAFVFLQPQILLANDERTFFGKCEGVEPRLKAVLTALPGHWYYSGSETWDVASVSVAPSGRTYDGDSCSATADVEADIKVGSKIDTINGGFSANYKFRRSQPQVRLADSESRVGWRKVCRPAQDELVSIIDNDALIQFSTVVSDTGSGYCDLNIQGTVVADGKSKIYTFKLVDENTLIQFRGDRERIYRKVN